jgi:hypothetical protein
MRKSGIAYASSRIRPFSLATLPITYLRKRTLPAQTRPGKGKEDETVRPLKYKRALKLTNIQMS